MVAVVSSALAAAEPHSLAPPCDHSAEVPVPFMPQPGALAFKGFCHEGFSTGSPFGCVAKPRMSSASYQRYSAVRGGGEEAELPGEKAVWERAEPPESIEVIAAKPTKKKIHEITRNTTKLFSCLFV